MSLSDAVQKRAADNIRIISAAMVEKAQSGHPGGAMGGADFISVLFSEFLRFDPDNLEWPMRDRFFLDPGHMSPMLYSILHLAAGTYTSEDLAQFRQWGSKTPGHPELDRARGVENTSGPLGQGHAMALGAAIAERFLVARFGEWMAHKTFTYISDGGIQEEISQGVGRLAGHLGLSNFIMFYDSNDIQLSHDTAATSSEDTARKYEAWGWRTETVDGSDAAAIRAALKRAVAEKNKPTLIVGKTVMGKGALAADGSSFERQCSTHGMPLSKSGASFENTVRNLGGDPSSPFAVFPEVSAHFEHVRADKRAQVRLAVTAYTQWRNGNSQLASKLDEFLAGSPPAIDYNAIQQKSNIATRAASGAVLSTLAKTVDNMIVCSADLSNSDNTDAYLKQTMAFGRNDFSGKFLQAGVAELTMAAVANGMALHGGVFVACGTFFVFSDYMKPAVRLAALMGLPVKYVWTHDAFRVGEDGPTHQPVEHEAQIRLLEKINNLEGHRSMLVLRPADAAETTVAWRLAMENTHTPTALILSRQNIADLPAPAGATRVADANRAERGAYTVVDCNGKPDIILVGNGSEVAVLVETAARLTAEKKLRVRVVSAISDGLLREQDAAYVNGLLPYGAPILALTAGSAEAMRPLIGPLGDVIGLGRFGASAPFKVLDEKFGYTTAAVFEKAVSYVGKYRVNLTAIQALK